MTALTRLGGSPLSLRLDDHPSREASGLALGARSMHHGAVLKLLSVIVWFPLCSIANTSNL